MAIKTKFAKKVLTKKDQKHLTTDAGIHSMAAMKRQVEFMKKTEPDHPMFVCHECFFIAKKLKLL
jgi:hypothetical protein